MTSTTTSVVAHDGDGACSSAIGMPDRTRGR